LITFPSDKCKSAPLLKISKDRIDLERPAHATSKSLCHVENHGTIGIELGLRSLGEYMSLLAMFGAEKFEPTQKSRTVAAGEFTQIGPLQAVESTECVDGNSESSRFLTT